MATRQGKATVVEAGQGGTKLFWCHILEHSAELLVAKKQAHCYTLNLVTLSHFVAVFGVAYKLSIWGGPQAQHLRRLKHNCTQSRTNNCRHLTAYYTSLKGSHCLATLCTTILPHITIMPHILMTSADKGTTLCPCVTSLHIAAPGTGWFPLSQCHHSPNITNALFTAF